MKNIILASLIITTLFLTSCDVDSTKGLKTTSGASGISFKVVPKSVLYGNKEDLSKLPPIIEYDENGPVFYDVDRCNNYKIPKTDSSYKSIKISTSDPDYIDKSIGTINYVNWMPILDNDIESLLKYSDRIISSDRRCRIVVTKNTYPYIVSLGLLVEPKLIYRITLSSSNVNRIINSRDTCKDFSNQALGSFFFIDSDYNYEIWRFEDSQLKLQTRLALNPDDIVLYKKENPTLEQFLSAIQVEARDFSSTFYDKVNGGFIWNKISELKSKVNGKTVNMPLPLEYKDGILMCPFLWFIKQLDSTTETSYANGQTTIDKVFRFYDDNDDYKMHETDTHIVLNVEKSKILINNLPIDLSIAPYEKNGELMVPLEDICKYLGAEYHFRPIDNSVLIARFPMSDCR